MKIEWEENIDNYYVFHEAINLPDGNHCVVHNNLSDFFAKYNPNKETFQKIWSISILIVDNNRDLRLEYDVIEADPKKMKKIAEQKYNELFSFFNKTI